MSRKRFPQPTVDAALGYAADARGRGVAYVRIATTAGDHLLRLAFRAGAGASDERATGYAALTAATHALRARGVMRARFALEDAQLIEDVTTRRDVPESIVLPYVRLRCALNQLEDFTLVRSEPSDLAQRARAEVAMNVAA